MENVSHQRLCTSQFKKNLVMTMLRYAKTWTASVYFKRLNKFLNLIFVNHEGNLIGTKLSQLSISF